jgi:dolichol-phosphate mannosyltransferase
MTNDPVRLSVVIPTWNEEGNVRALVGALHNSLKPNNIEYELIFIDDNSTDRTVEVLNYLVEHYPITIQKKVGERGKAQSLLQGFASCKHGLIAMIDADMQYHPKYLPEMVNKITREHYDVVVAERNEQEVSFLRRFISKSFSWLFVRVLHGLKTDAQSGMKVFKKDILEEVNLTAKGWAFDMDFLVQAKNEGYRIGGVPIVFGRRFSGQAKINLFSASWQIGVGALRLKFRDVQVLGQTKRSQG